MALAADAAQLLPRAAKAQRDAFAGGGSLAADACGLAGALADWAASLAGDDSAEGKPPTEGCCTPPKLTRKG